LTGQTRLPCLSSAALDNNITADGTCASPWPRRLIFSTFRDNLGAPGLCSYFAETAQHKISPSRRDFAAD
jgi:hypothetical protein